MASNQRHRGSEHIQIYHTSGLQKFRAKNTKFGEFYIDFALKIVSIILDHHSLQFKLHYKVHSDQMMIIDWMIIDCMIIDWMMTIDDRLNDDELYDDELYDDEWW